MPAQAGRIVRRVSRSRRTAASSMPVALDGLTLRKSGRIGIVGVPGEIKVPSQYDVAGRPVDRQDEIAAELYQACRQGTAQEKPRSRPMQEGLEGGCRGSRRAIRGAELVSSLFDAE
jgi:hypothetical protein